MKAIFLVTAALMAGNAVAQTPRNADEEAIARRDRELNELIIKHDAAAASRYYDEAFVLTTSSGKLKSKGDLVAEISTPGLVITANDNAEVVVRVRGDTAVLTGVLHQRGSYGGKDFDYQVHVTDTWVRSDGEWKILAGHASRL